MSDRESPEPAAEPTAEVDVLVPDVLPADGDEGAEDATLESVALEPAPSSPSRGGSLTTFDPLRAYLAEVSRYPTLTAEEEADLARRFRATGDPEAARELITANLVLVVKISMMFRRAITNVLDLIQEGNLGLMQAVQKFDPDVGARLPTYASWWIKAYIIKYLTDNIRLVRVGTTNDRRKLLFNLRKEQDRMRAEGFVPEPKLLAEHFGVSEQDVIDVQQSLEGGDVSIDAPVDGSSERSRADLLPQPGTDLETEVAQRELQELVRREVEGLRAELKPREQAILDRRLLPDDSAERATLQALGDEFGTSREAVRQMEVRVKRKVEERLRERLGHALEITPEDV